MRSELPQPLENNFGESGKTAAEDRQLASAPQGSYKCHLSLLTFLLLQMHLQINTLLTPAKIVGEKNEDMSETIAHRGQNRPK